MSKQLRLSGDVVLAAMQQRLTRGAQGKSGGLVATRVQAGGAKTQPRAGKQTGQRMHTFPGLPPAVCEYRFCPGRRWRFDFSWPERLVALEVEGGIWRRGGGAHSHPLNIERDIEKYNAAAELGWRIFRCAPENLKRGEILDTIKRALA